MLAAKIVANESVGKQLLKEIITYEEMSKKK